jgi:hypothetical protein
VAIVTALLHVEGIDVNDIGPNKTPLHDAAEWGHVEICRQLVAHGASLVKADIFGDIPLVRKTHCQVFLLLWDKPHCVCKGAGCDVGCGAF